MCIVRQLFIDFLFKYQQIHFQAINAAACLLCVSLADNLNVNNLPVKQPVIGIR